MRTSAANHSYEGPNSAVADIFSQMEFRATRAIVEDFIANLHCQEFDRLSLAQIKSGAIDAIHHNLNTAQTHNTHYLINFQLEGECLVEQSDRCSHLLPGDFIVCATNAPYRLQFPQPFKQAVLIVPGTLLREMFDSLDSCIGCRMAMDIPTNGLLSQFVASLVTRIEQLEPDILRRLEHNLLDLLLTALQASARCRETHQQSSGTEYLSRIKQLIAMHLREPKLSPDFIAIITGISTRYLHMLFKNEGISVSRYIQQQRLAACRRALLSDNQRQRPIIDIALEWGFGDISHFHRCFKAQYGITPRQLRLRGCDA